jgi:hypothetical protein
MHEMNDACLCSCKCNAIKELNTWGVTAPSGGEEGRQDQEGRGPPPGEEGRRAPPGVEEGPRAREGDGGAAPSAVVLRARERSRRRCRATGHHAPRERGRGRCHSSCVEECDEVREREDAGEGRSVERRLCVGEAEGGALCN